MSKPKVLIFAPREEPPETVNALEGIGCEIVFGDRDWQLPRTTHEEAVVEAAARAVALGTSIRLLHQPAHHAGVAARIVIKYTVRVDDMTPRRDRSRHHGVPRADRVNCFGVAETTVTFMLAVEESAADADVQAGSGGPRKISPITSAAAARTDFPANHRSRRPRADRNAVAQLLAPWRARVIAYDHVRPRISSRGVTAVD